MYQRGYGGFGGYGPLWSSSAAGSIVAIFIVLAVLFIYVTIKAAEQVARTYIRFPDSKAMKWTGITTLGLWLATGICFAILGNQQNPNTSLQEIGGVLLGVAIMTTLILVLVAKVVELIRSETFQPEPNARMFIGDVLKPRSWWNPTASTVTP